MHVPFRNFRKESAVPGYSRRYLCHHLEFWWRDHLSEWNLCQIHTFFSRWTFPWGFLKVFGKWKAPYVSGVWIQSPIPLWLPVDWSVRFPPFSAKRKRPRIQLFRERLSEKVHATNPKGIVGGFELTVFQRNLKEWQERPSAEAVDICLRVLKESNKTRFDSYSVRNSVLTISHITFRDCRVHMFSDNLSRNSCINKHWKTRAKGNDIITKCHLRQ